MKIRYIANTRGVARAVARAATFRFQQDLQLILFGEPHPLVPFVDHDRDEKILAGYFQRWHLRTEVGFAVEATRVTHPDLSHICDLLREPHAHWIVRVPSPMVPPSGDPPVTPPSGDPPVVDPPGGTPKGRRMWTPAEDAILKDAVARGMRWPDIALLLRGRTRKSVRERWCDHLDPLVNNEPFSELERRILREKLLVFGTKWSRIKEFFHWRTGNKCKNEAHRLKYV